jgi:hypothetical protein
MKIFPDSAKPKNSQEADLAAIQKLHETDMAVAKIHDINTLITLMTVEFILLPPRHEPIRGRNTIITLLKKMWIEFGSLNTKIEIFLFFGFYHL